MYRNVDKLLSFTGVRYYATLDHQVLSAGRGECREDEL